MYVRELAIHNLRSFASARIALNVPGVAAAAGRLPNVTLLLGDNGSGKTSVLRSIALAALAPVIASGSGYVPFSLVRRTGPGGSISEARVEAELELHEQDGSAGIQRVEAKLLRTRGFVDRFAPLAAADWAEAMWEESSPAFLLVGYGSTRRADAQSPHLESVRQKSRVLRYDRVAGLFEEAVTLVSLSGWLPRYRTENPTRHAQVVMLVNRLLSGHGELLPEPRESEYLFRVGGSDLPFQALSDGYRGYVSWITDLLYHLCMGAGQDGEITDHRGVVLVDEVDLHLHPEWQQVVIPTLATVLPNLQFVFTSHSPIVAGTLWKENVFVLASHQADGVTATTIEPSPQEVFGLSADQILTSGHFGLRSTRNPEIGEHLAREARQAQTGDPEAALKLMRLMALGGAAVDEADEPDVSSEPAPPDEAAGPAEPAKKKRPSPGPRRPPRRK